MTDLRPHPRREHRATRLARMRRSKPGHERLVLRSAVRSSEESVRTRGSGVPTRSGVGPPASESRSVRSAGRGAGPAALFGERRERAAHRPARDRVQTRHSDRPARRQDHGPRPHRGELQPGRHPGREPGAGGCSGRPGRQRRDRARSRKDRLHQVGPRHEGRRLQAGSRSSLRSVRSARWLRPGR